MSASDSDNPDPRLATPDENFSQNVRFLREKQGLSQEAVAEQMQERGHSFHQATIYKIETGSRKVSVSEAQALASILKGEVSQMLETPRAYVEVWYVRNRIDEFEDSKSNLYEAMGQYRDARREILYEMEDRPDVFQKAGGRRSIKWWRNQAIKSATAVVEEAELPDILGEGDQPEGKLTLDQRVQIARWELDRVSSVEESVSERLESASLNLKRLEASRYLHGRRDVIIEALKTAGSPEHAVDSIESKLALIDEEAGLWTHIHNLIRLLGEVEVTWGKVDTHISDLIKDPELNPPPKEG